MGRLSELCDLVNGQLVGDPNLEISGAASIGRASSGEITFVTNEKYLAEFEQSNAVAAIVAPGLVSSKPVIETEQPESQFAAIVSFFHPKPPRNRIGISPSAFVSPTAKISDDVDIYPGAVIGDDVEIGCGAIVYPNATVMERCRIGAGVKIYPSAVIYPDCQIGDRSIIHAGAVIGANGFGYKTRDGRHQPCAQLGDVIVESDVEIGCNSTVDRGTYDSTIIGEGTKIDNLVMVGHNCQIGKHNIMVSQVGVAGSCTTGEYVVMGGQVGIGDHLTIGNNVSIKAKAGVMQDVDENQVVLGSPAIPARQFMQQVVSITKLPEMRRQLKRIEKQLEQAPPAPDSNGPNETGRPTNEIEQVNSEAA